ncbi:MAG: hypothetical protein HY754_12840, partial [Nitrospirae bacterium]|nr:hypothetical protein [Nitrospirota bacterium]
MKMINSFFKKGKILSAIIILLLILLFGTFFFKFLSIPLWDYDFWWHIATGRDIVMTGSLPDKYPFSYTYNLEENKGQIEFKNSVLKHYWLSQVIFFLIYDYSGAKGIVILRSVLLTLTLLVVFWRLLRWSVSFPISFIFVFSLFDVLTTATGERPVLFTILFSAITFFIIEEFKGKRDRRIFLLSPLMLLWANLHGGFILGVTIITVFMLGEGIEMILKRTAYTKREVILFYAATTIAVGFSFVNPTGWDAFFFTLLPKYKIFSDSTEYYSPIYIFKNNIAPIHQGYGYIFLAIITAAVLILRNKRLTVAHIILLIGTLIMSLSAIRFIVYFAIISSIVIGKELDVLTRNFIEKRFSKINYKKIMDGITVVVIAIFLSVWVYKGKIKFDIAKNISAPVAAVDFLEKNRIRGNIFNGYNYGGYIAWRLYPWKKNFIDTRAPNLTVKKEYSWIVEAMDIPEEITPFVSGIPFWERLLNHYKVNFILFHLIDMFDQVPLLIFRLAESERWVPVYCDS